MSDAQRTIGVVGGSLGGLFIAALLHQQGHRVTVFERSRSGLARRGAGLVAQQELFDLLHRVGRADAAEVGVVATERITIDRSGRVLDRNATPQTQVSWDHLYSVLRDLLPPDRYVLGHPVEQVVADEDGVELRFADAPSQRFDGVVGADGLTSVTRQAVVPGHTADAYAGYVTWRGLVPERALVGTPADLLLGRFAFFNARGAHMLGYLVPGPAGEIEPGSRRYNWVWYRRVTADALARIMAAAGRPTTGLSLAPGDLPDDLRRALQSDAQGELPAPFATAVLAEPRPFLQAIVDYEPPRMARGRVALLGDAAFVVRPHTAMGAAKAAGDALALADALRQRSVVEAFAAYDRERAPVGRAIAAYGRRLGESLPL